MKIIYACEQHIDDAMDDIVNEYETFPLVAECNNEKCQYCKEDSKYKIEANNS